MKRILSLTALLVSLIVFAPSSTEAKTADSISGGALAVSAAEAQPGRRRWNRRVRVTTQTRLVRRGRALYREVYQYRYHANGRVTVRLISRTRVR